MTDTASDRRDDATSFALAQVVGWLVLGLVNVVVGFIALPLTRGGVGARLWCHLWDVGQMVGVGLVAGLAVGAYRRWVVARRGLGNRVGYLALGLVSAAWSQWLLWTDLVGIASGVAPSHGPAAARGLAVLLSTTIPVAAGVGAVLGERVRLRYLAVAAAVGVAAGHQWVLPNLYSHVHAHLSMTAAALLGGCLPALLRPVVAGWSDRTLTRRRVLTGVAVLAAAAASLANTPSAVSSVLAQLPGAFVSRYRPSSVFVGDVDVAASSGPWFEHRRGASATAPSTQRLLPSNGIVILLVVDAMRADVLNAPAVSELPGLAELSSRAVRFTHAWSPAPNTNATVAALHAGKYPGQLKWELTAVGSKARLWPNDETARLGDLLENASVPSALVVSKPMSGLAPRHQLTKGMGETISARNQHAKQVVNAFLRWLGKSREGPLFAYLHVTDAHAPYNLAGKHETPWDGYLAELELVEREIKRLMAELRARGLDERTVLILTADHGEAFGEHNSTYHGTSVYEEMMRVPLLVVGHGLEPRLIDQPVTLVDLAPTVLDLFGVDTPGTFMGQSLVPLLAGEQRELTRPIFLDSHKDVHGMVFDDLTKIVVRRGVPELYDLVADPKELDNVYDVHAQAKARFGAYRRFVRAHEMTFESQ